MPYSSCANWNVKYFPARLGADVSLDCIVLAGALVRHRSLDIETWAETGVIPVGRQTYVDLHPFIVNKEHHPRTLLRTKGSRGEIASVNNCGNCQPERAQDLLQSRFHIPYDHVGEL